MKTLYNVASYLAVVVAFIALTITNSYAITSKDFTVFRSKEDGFIFQYPKTWSKVPSTHGNTKIKIVSNNGNGEEDCSVHVQKYNPQFVNTSAKEFVRLVGNVEKYQAGIRKSMPDAVVVDSGTTNISNQDAFYAATTFTFKSVGVEIPFKMFSVATLKKGRVYTVTCRAAPDSFESQMPMFQLIFSGFVLLR